MKKVIRTLLFSVVMAIALSACGNEEVTHSSEYVGESQDIVDDSTEVVESVETEEAVSEAQQDVDEVVEDVVESEAVESVTENFTEEVIEEVVEEPFAFNAEYAMMKINRLLEAHTKLIDSGKMLEHHIQYDTEGLSTTCRDLTQFTTADGNAYKTFNAIAGTAIVYYNDYVNNNGDYYDFETWLNSQSDDMAIRNLIPGLEKDESDTKDILLCEAIGLIAYMKSFNPDAVIATNFVETKEYTISNIQSAYKMTIACEGVDEFEAIYDEAGNLLNIWPIAEDWDKYMTSFPNGDRGSN